MSKADRLINLRDAAAMLGVRDAAAMLGVHPDTLRRWDDEGRLVAERTLGNHRRYKLSVIEALQGQGITDITDEGDSEVRASAYCRVSSHDQEKKGDLERQVGRVHSRRWPRTSAPSTGSSAPGATEESRGAPA